MHRLSRHLVRDWDSLAGLMDVANDERHSIRSSDMYNDERARAEKMLSIINHKEDFSREKLADCLREIHKLELVKPITTGEWRNL